MNTSPTLARWTGLCAVAEMIGMTSAAAAARGASAVGGTGAGPTAARLGIIVAGGLIEGTALALLQYAGLRRWLPGLSRRAWVTTTVAVAGVGWALASLNSALPDETVAGASAEAGPSLALVTLGGLALGAVMGALLGAAQAVVLRGRVHHARQWVAANAVGWSPAMAIIMVGATTPDRSWGTPAVVMWGTLTGLLAGAVLGLITGLWLPNLAAGNVHNRVVLRLLGSRAHRVLSGSLIGLRITGRRSGRAYELPVTAAQAPSADSAGSATTSSTLVVVPGAAESKTWWRNIDTDTDVDVLVAGHWQHARASLRRPTDTDYPRELALYRERWPRTAVAEGAVLVGITLTTN